MFVSIITLQINSRWYRHKNEKNGLRNAEPEGGLWISYVQVNWHIAKNNTTLPHIAFARMHRFALVSTHTEGLVVPGLQVFTVTVSTHLQLAHCRQAHMRAWMVVCPGCNPAVTLQWPGTSHSSSVTLSAGQVVTAKLMDGWTEVQSRSGVKKKPLVSFLPFAEWRHIAKKKRKKTILTAVQLPCWRSLIYLNLTNLTECFTNQWKLFHPWTAQRHMDHSVTSRIRPIPPPVEWVDSR